MRRRECVKSLLAVPAAEIDATLDVARALARP